jgi:hypothetical protein
MFYNSTGFTCFASSQQRNLCHVERVLVDALDGSNLPHLHSNNTVADQVLAKAAVITEVIADMVSAEQPAAVSSPLSLANTPAEASVDSSA